SGPVNVPDPPGAKVIKIENAREMLRAVESALPTDVAIFAAAVADWSVANAGEHKLKKQPGHTSPELALVENPDILATIAGRKKPRHPRHNGRPKKTTAETGDRLCRRDRERRCQRQGETRPQTLRLDPGQRCLAAIRRDGRRSQHDHARACIRRRGLAATKQG